MDTRNLDIVYCVKEDDNNEELKYSLRSLQNIPHRSVWIFGGCPSFVNLDVVNYVPVSQNRGSKWKNAGYNLRQVCATDGVSENFILFNDDFFVMKKIDKLGYYFDRKLKDRIRDFTKKSFWGHKSQYTLQLIDTEKTLRRQGKETYNYELHIPMIFNKYKLKEMSDNDSNIGARRSLYGNTYIKGGKQMADVKVYTLTDRPRFNTTFLSTSDHSFTKGVVGDIIREKFKYKCKYEK